MFLLRLCSDFGPRTLLLAASTHGTYVRYDMLLRNMDKKDQLLYCSLPYR
jgi:hypothetical protein